MPINIVSTTISLPYQSITKNNIEKLLLKKLKQAQGGKCCSYGYVKEDSIMIIQRSQGIIKCIDSISNVMYDVNYKIDTYNPQKGDIIECIVNNTTKMGTIAYLCADEQKYTLKNSPILVIIPLSDESNDLKNDEKIEVEVMTSKLKYNSIQIQVIGKVHR